MRVRKIQCDNCRNTEKPFKLKRFDRMLFTKIHNAPNGAELPEWAGITAAEELLVFAECTHCRHCDYLWNFVWE